jgi:aspartyl-tRNA(Asn)/glutamyl-tRNA(Gln) amidotransferase subunit A
MTWSVQDSAIMLQAIAGHDPLDPTTGWTPVPDYSASLVEDITGLKVGVPRHFFFADDPAIDREVLATVDVALSDLEKLGAEVVEVSVPMLEHSAGAHIPIMMGEAFAYHQGTVRESPELFGEMCRARFRQGALFTAADYVQGQRVRNVLKREFAEVLDEVDVIVSPTFSNPPGRFDEMDPMSSSRSPSFTAPYNMTGMPAVSVPCGFTSAGLPVGLQIAGRPFDEPAVLRTAFTYQQHARLFEKRPALDWHDPEAGGSHG